MLYQLSYSGKEIGAPSRPRSDTLLIKSQVLCQLSYRRKYG